MEKESFELDQGDGEEGHLPERATFRIEKAKLLKAKGGV